MKSVYNKNQQLNTSIMSLIPNLKVMENALQGKADALGTVVGLCRHLVDGLS